MSAQLSEVVFLILSYKNASPFLQKSQEVPPEKNHGSPRCRLIFTYTFHVVTKELYFE